MCPKVQIIFKVIFKITTKIINRNHYQNHQNHLPFHQQVSPSSLATGQKSLKWTELCHQVLFCPSPPCPPLTFLCFEPFYFTFLYFVLLLILYFYILPLDSPSTFPFHISLFCPPLNFLFLYFIPGPFELNFCPRTRVRGFKESC